MDPEDVLFVYLDTYLRTWLARYLPADGEGQGLVEYALLLVVIAIPTLFVVARTGRRVRRIFRFIVFMLS